MLGINVTILRYGAPDARYDLRLDDSMESSKNSVYQGLSERGLAEKLEYLLSLTRGDVQEIKNIMERTEPKYIKGYSVNEATYKRVFG